MKATASLRTFTELSVLHVAAGNGYTLPEQATQPTGWLIASGTSESVTLALREAESNFLIEQEHALAPVKARIEEMEATIKRSANRTHGAMSPAQVYQAGFSPHTSEEQLDATTRGEGSAAELRDLKEQASKHTYVTFPDPDIHRSSLLDLLKRSRFRAMSVLDEDGFLLSVAHANGSKFLAIMAWSSLTIKRANAASLIRSSSTGGANIYSLAGEERPVCNLISLPNRRTTANLKRKLRKPSASAIQGAVLVVEGEDAPIAAPTVDVTQVPDLLRNVYASPDGCKVAVTFSAEAAQAWEALQQEAQQYYTRTHPSLTTEASKVAVAGMLCRAYNVLAHALRATVTQALLANAKRLGPPAPGRTVEIGALEMQQCGETFHELFLHSSGLQANETRRKNAQAATEARQPTPAERHAEIIKAAPALTELLDANGGKASLREVIRSPKLSQKLAEAIVEAFPARFVILQEPMKTGGRVRTYFALRENALQDPEEAKDRLEAAQAIVAEMEVIDGPAVLAPQLVILQKMADKFASGGELGAHCVPIDRMSNEQIRKVPEILRTFPSETHLSVWSDKDMPPGSDYDPVRDIEDGMPVLWLRYNASAKPAAGLRMWPKYVPTEWDDNQPLSEAGAPGNDLN